VTGPLAARGRGGAAQTGPSSGRPVRDTGRVATIVLPADVLDAAERSASPAAAGVALARLIDNDASLTERLAADPGLLEALVAVTATSRSLTQVCLTDPDAMATLADLDRRPPCRPADAAAVVRWKRLEYLRIAARDITGVATLEEVGSALSAMADDVLGAAWSLTRQPDRRLAVVAMGKYGGRELNYASDVDVLFVGDGDVKGLIDVARRCFRVDADLRPEGRSGPLVRTLDAFRSYWDRWAKTWEFQSLLKCRAAAGDPIVGPAFAEAAARAVWSRRFGPDEVREIRVMKARAEGEMARRGLSERELKRGRGGIRDIEFAIQLLQLVHGRADASLRSPNTLVALRELASAGYVDGDDAEVFADAYRFLRTVEHRLQLWDEAQVHAIPEGGEALERLARVCGYRGSVASDAVGAFLGDLRNHQRAARTIHERLFFRPLLEAFNQGPQADMTPFSATMPEAAVAERLAAFGFTEATRTRDALVELTHGLTRSSRLMQQVLPLLLEWLSETPDPDAGLLGLRTLVASPHRAERLVRMFRDAPDGAQRLCRLIGSSRLVTVGLERNPERLSELADPDAPAPVDSDTLRTRIADTLSWREPAEQIGALRRIYHDEELRVALRDLLERDDIRQVGEALTTVSQCMLEHALKVACHTSGVTVPVAVIAMGRFGGAELSYASDLDIQVVHAATDEHDAAEAERLATELRHLVNGRTPAERVQVLDFDLRPEGKQGPLARSLAGYEQYYERWAQTWERQALLRSRFAAGDAGIGARFGEIAARFLSRPFTEAEELEVRRMKARIERERIPATDDPDFHLKLGRGSLSDVEWTVQLLQLRHGLLRSPGTLSGLDQLAEAGIVSARDAAALHNAYVYCERTRNRLYLVRGAPGDALPARPEQLAKLARSLGTTGSELRDEYRRVTRRCREVTERLFYGSEGAPRSRPVPGSWPR